MNITEAVCQAIANRNMIYRIEGDARKILIPANEPTGILLFHGGKTEKWNATADDMLAQDWEVLPQFLIPNPKDAERLRQESLWIMVHEMYRYFASEHSNQKELIGSIRDSLIEGLKLKPVCGGGGVGLGQGWYEFFKTRQKTSSYNPDTRHED